MANGSGGPLPELSAYVWDQIKDAEWTDGGWNVGGTTKWLYTSRNDPRVWQLLEADAPDALVKATISREAWTKIQGGTLNESERYILSDSRQWFTHFFLDGSGVGLAWPNTNPAMI